VRKADYLKSFMCRLSGNMWASNSWNPSRNPLGMCRHCFC